MLLDKYLIGQKEGKSGTAIAKMLNRQKIINPTGYKRKVQKNKMWTYFKRRNKRRNKIYLGNV